MKPWIKSMIDQARRGAEERGIRWMLTNEDVLRAIAKSGMRCQITGRRFSFEWQPGWSRRPWVPTIDRIQSGGPYSSGNIRIVCFVANHAMREWGEYVFLQLIDELREAAAFNMRPRQPEQLRMPV